MDFIPTSPYIFSPEAKSAGKTPEKLLFSFEGYRRLSFIFYKMNSRPAKEEKFLQNYLRWLFKRAMELQPDKVCPRCKINKIKYISISWTNGLYSMDLCCEECKRELEIASFKKLDFVQANFRLVEYFPRYKKSDRKEEIKLLCSFYSSSKKSNKELFNLFVGKSPVSI